MPPKIRVNIFTENGSKTTYTSGIFSKYNFVEDVIRFYGLTKPGLTVYVNGKKAEFVQMLKDLGIESVCFMSCIYGEQKLPKRKDS